MWEYIVSQSYPDARRSVLKSTHPGYQFRALGGKRLALHILQLRQVPKYEAGLFLAGLANPVPVLFSPRVARLRRLILLGVYWGFLRWP
jgi:hypothetical protein